MHPSWRHSCLLMYWGSRRDLLSCAAAAVAGIHVPASIEAEGTSKMYGLIAKLISVPNRREDLISILQNGTAQMPGCPSYVIAKDSADENTIWVTEVWNSAPDHDASLSLPIVKDTIDKGKPLIANFSRVAVTEPVAATVPAENRNRE